MAALAALIADLKFISSVTFNVSKSPLDWVVFNSVNLENIPSAFAVIGPILSELLIIALISPKEFDSINASFKTIF